MAYICSCRSASGWAETLRGNPTVLFCFVFCLLSISKACRPADAAAASETVRLFDSDWPRRLD